MKIIRITLLISAILISNLLWSQDQSQKKVLPDPDWSLRANWNYQYFSFEGRRTNSSAFGIIAEKRINYEATVGIGINYISRMEDGQEQNQTLPEYNQILYFQPFIRKYFDKALSGPYTGFAIGLGIPNENGTQWDLGGHFGYNLHKGRLSLDFLMQLGFGSFRYSQNQFDSNGLPIGNFTYKDYGFYFRPGLSLGFAL